MDHQVYRFIKVRVRAALIILALSDFAVCLASVLLAIYIRFDGQSLDTIESIESPILTGVVFGMVIPPSIAAMGLYQSHFRGSLHAILLRTVAGFFCGCAVLATLYYLFPALNLGRGALGLAMGIAFFFIAMLHAFFFKYLERHETRVRVLVLGTGNHAASINRRMRRKSDRRRFRLIGFIILPGESERIVDGDLILEHSNQDLLQLCKEHKIDEIVTAADAGTTALPVEQLLEARFRGVRITDIVTFHEREQRKLPIELFNCDSLIYADGFGNSWFWDYVKRCVDVIVSAIVFIFVWPIILLTAISIVIEDGKDQPILYRQTRVGRNGRKFMVLKFRSMRTDAEASGVAQWATESDSRITRVGNIIRQLRIDELPQLFNVLAGDMSLVGPRPERPYFVEKLSIEVPHYEKRHTVLPGITGWAQINYPYGRSLSDSMRKQEFDLYYIKNRSLFLDFLILLQTTEVVLFKSGQAR